MHFLKVNRDAALAGIAWAVAAIALLTLRDAAHGMIMLWLPSGVATGALFASRPGRRPAIIAALLVANIVVAAWYRMAPLGIAAFAVANLSEALITVALAQRVIGKRRLTALRQVDLTLLLGAALAGSAAGALISLPYRPQIELAQLAWWFLATALGTTVGAPVLVYLQALLRAGKQPYRLLHFGRVPFDYLGVLVLLFALAWWVLGEAAVPLGPLMLVGLAFAVLRFGYLGASGAVLAFGLAATGHSLGGAPPAAFGHFPPFAAGLVLQLYMLLMLLASLPLAALLLKHDRLALTLKLRNARMHETLKLLGLAEEVARIGRWRFDPRSGTQDWSDMMFRINGLDPRKYGRDPGDIRALLPDGGAELFGQLANHEHDRAHYSVNYRTRTPAGEERFLRMHATNQFGSKGELVTMFGVVMDVTEHRQRQDALDRERTRAMRLAAEAQFMAHTDPLTGLANRRRAMQQLDKCIRKCAQEPSDLALIVFDIDHFKQVNDRFGHQVGDDVLIRVADIARGEVRASDLVGRIGGEEFVWILPGASPEVARSAAQRLCWAIAEQSPAGGLPRVTASIGYAVFEPGDDASALLGRADAALYAAKQAGRNQVKQAA